MKKTTILALSWRDICSPKSGGAEVNTHQMLNTLDPEYYKVIHFSPQYEGLKNKEKIDNILYLRKGGVFSVIRYAKKFYDKHSQEIDFVIDQCNTHRFFSSFWVPEKKRIFLIYQLTREIWDINLKFPWNRLGFLLEDKMLRLNRNDITITESESTKKDLLELGYIPDKVHIIPIGIDDRILGRVLHEKPENHDFVFAGRYSKYKGIDVSVEALGKVKEMFPDARLHIIGKRDDTFVNEVIRPIAQRYALRLDGDTPDVVLHGFVSEEEKFQIMEQSHCLLFPSQREGWGIIVTEAAAMGTPSVVFDSPGCRDAVNYGKAGYLCLQNTVEELANQMIRSIENIEEYSKIREAAHAFAQEFQWKKNKHLLEELLK